jgi:hypothetical protein
MDAESRLARQNRRFFRKPKANRSGARGFTGFPGGFDQKSSHYEAQQGHALDFYALACEQECFIPESRARKRG